MILRNQRLIRAASSNMKFILAVSVICHAILPTAVNGFVPASPFLQRNNPQSQVTFSYDDDDNNNNKPNRHSYSTSSRLFMAKLWDRMEIEEDEEPMWYLLNCVAGLEIDLLRQCRQRCGDMEDAKKFVVPTITSTRSHGANRMVQDTKIKYQGYVFAKLRLCSETYEAIQELDLCRSWMGTVNKKGHKMLPPSPVTLSEDEIENFGLEDEEFVEEEEDDEDAIILDTEEKDKEDKAAEIEEAVQKEYGGFRVDDMVKVTAKNKFFNEDGIVRRLKDSKLLIKFYTYGTVYEEWLDPVDIRNLTTEEIMKGLTGASEPITQRDLDGPDDSRPGYDDDRRPGDKRNLVSGMGGDTRNRRQDSNADRFRPISEQNNGKERENWNQYKDNERRNQGGRIADGDVDVRGSDRGRDNKWAQGDVDSQWGRQDRTTQGQNRQEKSPQQSSGGDWSKFVSPASSTPSQAETDDFFASLMTDLSNDLGSGSKKPEPNAEGGSKDSAGASSDEDDFFASLMSEIEEDNSGNDSGSSSKATTSGSSRDDDFFASLEADIQGSNKVKQEPSKKPQSAGDELDNFFSEFAAFDETESSSGSGTANGDGAGSANGDADDFFAGLEAELESELAVDTPKEKSAKSAEPSAMDLFAEPDFDIFEAEAAVAEKKQASQKSTPKAAETAPPAPSSAASADLSKFTVPVLKEMLRERGLKVSGKKSDLLERLQ